MICLLYDYLSCELDPEEEEIKVRQRRQSKKMSTNCFSRIRKSENLDSFCFVFLRIYFEFSLSLTFFLCLSSFLSGFAAHFIVFLLHGKLWLANFLEKEKFNFQSVVCKQRNWRWIFPQNVTFFLGV